MRMLSTKYSSVTGEVLLTSGYVNLLSAFSQRYRKVCIFKWQKALNEEGLECNSEFNFTELFGNSYKIRRWHENSLPSDTMSVNNALTIENTKWFSLLIDPQRQGYTWLSAQSEETG
jgi:dynein heavy chain